jgi:hypothetical protein
MTQAHVCANWSGVPSLTGLWLEALLRMAAMLWVSVVATFKMSPSRRARECDTPPAPAVLPRGTHDISEETNAVESHDQYKPHAEQRTQCAPVNTGDSTPLRVILGLRRGSSEADFGRVPRRGSSQNEKAGNVSRQKPGEGGPSKSVRRGWIPCGNAAERPTRQLRPDTVTRTPPRQRAITPTGTRPR